MTKVLHINSNYLYTRLHENLIEHLEILGIDNTIYMARKKGEDPKYQSKYDIYCPFVYENIDRFFYRNKQLKILKNLIKNISITPFELSHAHTLFTDGNISYQLYKKYQIPYVVTVRNTDINTFYKKRPDLHKRAYNILNNSSKIIFLSKVHKDEVFRKYIHKNKNKLDAKTEIIPNGIDRFWFDNEYHGKKLKYEEKINVVYAGRIDSNKNVLKTIEALVLLKKKGIKSTFTIVGKVQDSAVLKKILAITDIEIKMYSEMAKEQLIDIYRCNDIFIMPSLHETFGLVYPEAMSQGLPIIYTRGQGFDNQFVNGEVGYAINSQDASDISDKIILVMKNYEIISNECIKKYTKFNWRDISLQYSDIYDSIIKG